MFEVVLKNSPSLLALQFTSVLQLVYLFQYVQLCRMKDLLRYLHIQRLQVAVHAVIQMALRHKEQRSYNHL